MGDLLKSEKFLAEGIENDAFSCYTYRGLVYIEFYRKVHVSVKQPLLQQLSIFVNRRPVAES